MSRSIWCAISLSCLLACGAQEPVLRNAPKPNPAAVAGVAAAAAAAVTLASPQSAAAAQEQRTKGEPDTKGVTVKETVPSDVFDRADHAPSDAGVDSAPAGGAQPNTEPGVRPETWTPSAPPKLPPPPASR